MNFVTCYMQMFERIRNIKYVLVLFAIVIAIGSLLTSNYLIEDLKKEETNRMEVWAEAMRSLNSADENTDLNLVLKVINGNNKIPVVVLDKEGNVQTFRNVDIREDDKFAQVIVPDDQLSLAIGKSGQNARLASQITGWKIDIKDETTAYREEIRFKPNVYTA